MVKKLSEKQKKTMRAGLKVLAWTISIGLAVGVLIGFAIWG